MSSEARPAATYRGHRRNDWHFRYSKLGLLWERFYYARHKGVARYVQQNVRGPIRKRAPLRIRSVNNGNLGQGGVLI